jgi:hypothetical protein
LAYAVSRDQTLVAILPLVLKNHSNHVAAEGVTLEVVVPVGANVIYRSDNAKISLELAKGIMPGVEFRTVVVGNFVHVYCLIPAMNPGTSAALAFPFSCPETKIMGKTNAQTLDGKNVAMRYEAYVEMLFNTIIHTRDSPPSLSTFAVQGLVAGNVESMIKIGKAENLFQHSIGRRRLRDRLLLRNRRVVFVMPAAIPWLQDGIPAFALMGEQKVPVCLEDHQESRRWLFTGYAGISRLRPTHWKFR